VNEKEPQVPSACGSPGFHPVGNDAEGRHSDGSSLELTPNKVLDFLRRKISKSSIDCACCDLR
jgi:hypothetical protein